MQTQSRNNIAFCGYIGATPLIVFDTDNGTSSMWIFPTRSTMDGIKQQSINAVFN